MPGVPAGRAFRGAPAPAPQDGINPAITDELARASQRKPQAPPAAVDQALLPPMEMGMPSVAGLELEPRFDLTVNNAPAAQVFMSIVSGTRYSMLVHPGVGGAMSVNLKDVTIREALSAIRELYGYDYRIEGARIFIQPAGLQMRVFQVNYLPGQRRGTSDVRVTSGAVTDKFIDEVADLCVKLGGDAARVLEALEGFESRPLLASAPFRMPVQAVYKFTQHNDTRRIAVTVDPSILGGLIVKVGSRQFDTLVSRTVGSYYSSAQVAMDGYLCFGGSDHCNTTSSLSNRPIRSSPGSDSARRSAISPST